MVKLNYVISALVRHQQNFEKISRGAKKKWTEALIHNCYDVEAMEVLHDVIHHEDKQCLDWATKTLGEMCGHQVSVTYWRVSVRIFDRRNQVGDRRC